MLEIFREFRIRRNEWPTVVVVSAAFCVLEGLLISKFLVLFERFGPWAWRVFMRNFHMSGFDPWTYNVITRWHYGYSIVRHPLLAYFVWPLSKLNSLLWNLTGMNCAQFIAGVALLVLTVYSALFLRRLLMQVVGTTRWQADLLLAFFFGFAYIMMACIVPDHFCISLMLIMLTLLRAGEKLQKGEKFSPWEVCLLLIFTGGVTLSNAIVVLLAAWFVNGRRFWHWCQLLPYFLICMTLLIVGLELNKTEKHTKEMVVMEWFDSKTPRWQSLYENTFGESIILHRKHLLEDALVRRPVFVKYQSPVPYIAEGFIAALLLLGIVAAWRKRFLWLLMAVTAYMFALHFVIGFGLNEIYIMAAHWAYVIPICTGYLFVALRPRWLVVTLTAVVLSLSVYIYAHNVPLLYGHLMKEIRYR